MEATHVQYNGESVYCYLLRSVVYYIIRLYVVLHYSIHVVCQTQRSKVNDLGSKKVHMSSHTYVKLHLCSTIEPGHLTWIRVHYRLGFGKMGLGIGDCVSVDAADLRTTLCMLSW